MTCQRCRGLMDASHWFDDVLNTDIPFYRCLNCGEITDRRITLNRMAPLPEGQKRMQLKRCVAHGTLGTAG